MSSLYCVLVLMGCSWTSAVYDDVRSVREHPPLQEPLFNVPNGIARVRVQEIDWVVEIEDPRLQLVADRWMLVGNRPRRIGQQTAGETETVEALVVHAIPWDQVTHIEILPAEQWQRATEIPAVPRGQGKLSFEFEISKLQRTLQHLERDRRELLMNIARSQMKKENLELLLESAEDSDQRNHVTQQLELEQRQLEVDRRRLEALQQQQQELEQEIIRLRHQRLDELEASLDEDN